MKIKTKLNSVLRFATVLMILCIIPSGAFASGNNEKFTPPQNITDDNFADVQADMLASITEQITDLQSFYTNVSEASDASDLQEVLADYVPAHGCGPDGMKGPERMGQGPCGMPGLFNLDQVENVTDDNYTDVQTEIVDSIGNMTEMLNEQLENTTDENMTETLNEQITEFEELSTSVSEASSAEELQKVVLTYMQIHAVDLIEKEVEHIQTKISESENSTDDNMTEELSDKVTELTALIEEINAAESLEDLKQIISSSQGMPGMGHGMGLGPMQHGGCECPIGPMPENSTEA